MRGQPFVWRAGHGSGPRVQDVEGHRVHGAAPATEDAPSPDESVTASHLTPDDDVEGSRRMTTRGVPLDTFGVASAATSNPARSNMPSPE